MPRSSPWHKLKERYPSKDEISHRAQIHMNCHLERSGRAKARLCSERSRKAPLNQYQLKGIPPGMRARNSLQSRECNFQSLSPPGAHDLKPTIFLQLTFTPQRGAKEHRTILHTHRNTTSISRNKHAPIGASSRNPARAIPPPPCNAAPSFFFEKSLGLRPHSGVSFPHRIGARPAKPASGDIDRAFEDTLPSTIGHR